MHHQLNVCYFFGPVVPKLVRHHRGELGRFGNLIYTSREAGPVDCDNIPELVLTGCQHY